MLDHGVKGLGGARRLALERNRLCAPERRFAPRGIPALCLAERSDERVGALLGVGLELGFDQRLHPQQLFFGGGARQALLFDAGQGLEGALLDFASAVQDRGPGDVFSSHAPGQPQRLALIRQRRVVGLRARAIEQQRREPKRVVVGLGGPLPDVRAPGVDDDLGLAGLERRFGQEQACCA